MLIIVCIYSYAKPVQYIIIIKTIVSYIQSPNVHTKFLNVQRYSCVSIGKYFSFWIEVGKGILVLFVRHHTLVFGMDTLITGSKILVGS